MRASEKLSARGGTRLAPRLSGTCEGESPDCLFVCVPVTTAGWDDAGGVDRAAAGNIALAFFFCGWFESGSSTL